MSGGAAPQRRFLESGPAGREELRVSKFDNVAGTLLSLLILIGIGVAFLFVVWISGRVFTQSVPVPVVLEDVAGGGGREDGALGESMELDAPDAERISLEADIPQAPVEQTLSLVSEAVAGLQADLDDPSLIDEIQPRGGGRMHGDGRRPSLGSGGGSGGGDGSGTGPGGFPRHKRWEIYFQEGGTLDQYAQQLDFFGIELGVVGTGNVTYVRRLAQAVPEKRTAPADDERRLYMSWRQGGLKSVDVALLKKAGVDTTDKIILQFYPAEAENRLAQLEASFAGRTPSQIRRTRFGVRGQPGAFEFYVIDQSAL